MPTKDQTAAMKLYADIMEEIKYRIAAIDAGTSNELPVNPLFVQEFCFLQIRMICELIALGCLVAHGDITSKSAKLQKVWAADEILQRLESLHPDFFPVPVIQEKTSVGFHVTPKVPNPCPKTDFLDIYRKCGGNLHRGNLKKLVSQRSPTQVNYPNITSIAQKLYDLLSVHNVSMKGGRMVFLCILHNRDDNMKVQVAIAEAFAPLPSSP